MNDQDFKNLNFSVLGKNTELNGNLNFCGDTIINCVVKGDIRITNAGKLTLERDSFVDGNIYCNDVEIFGSVKGTITAHGTLSVRSSGVISGTINASQLSIFPGAVINIEAHTTEEVQENQEL